jgi:ADP-ribose pyrophosphatase
MPLKRWNKLSSKVLFQNSHWTYKLDHFKIENGIEGEYHYVHTNGATMVIPITESNKIILINQFRYLNQRESLEFPCGSVDEDLSHIENAHKELKEETGYDSNTILKVGEFCPYTGAADEMCYVFVANNLIQSPLPKDKTEEFELHFKSLDEVEELISENIIWDGLSISAWTLGRKKVKEILGIL